MVQKGYDPKSCGLIIYRGVNENFSVSNKYQQVARNEKNDVFALKPQYFHSAGVSDISNIFGKIDTSIMCNDLFFKGQTTNDDVVSITTSAIDVKLATNDITGEDPGNYAQQIDSINSPSVNGVGAYTGSLVINPAFTSFGVDVSANEVNIASLPGCELDTNSMVTVSCLGGASLSMPAFVIKQNPIAKIYVKKGIESGSIRYTLELAGQQVTSTYTPGWSRYTPISSAASRWITQSQVESALLLTDGINQIWNTVMDFKTAKDIPLPPAPQNPNPPKVPTFSNENDDQAKLAKYNSEVTDYQAKLRQNEIKYNNDMQKYNNQYLSNAVVPNVSAGIEYLAGIMNRQLSYSGDAKSISNMGGGIIGGNGVGTIMERFMTISYPYKKTVNVNGSMVSFFKNKVNEEIGISCNKKYSGFDALQSDAKAMTHGTLIRHTGGPVVDYGDYSMYYTQMLERGVLL